MESDTLKDLLTAAIVGFVLLFLILFAALSIRSDRFNDSENVKANVDGDFSIVEIETYGEVHEYIMCFSYKGGLEHLPNCKYCKDKKENGK